MEPKFLLMLFFIAVTISKTASTSRLLLQETYTNDVVDEDDNDFSEGLSDLESSEIALMDKEDVDFGQHPHAPAPREALYHTKRKLVEETIVDDVSGLVDTDDDVSEAPVAPALEVALELWEDARIMIQEKEAEDDISGLDADIDVSEAAVAPAPEAALESWEDDEYPIARKLYDEDAISGLSSAIDALEAAEDDSAPYSIVRKLYKEPAVVDDISGLDTDDVTDVALPPALQAALEYWADDDYTTTARELIQETVSNDIETGLSPDDLSVVAVSPAVQAALESWADSIDDGEAGVEEVPEYIYDVLEAETTVYA